MSAFDPADFNDTSPPSPSEPDTRATAQAKAQSASATAFFDRVPAQLSEVIATLASLGVTDTEIKALLKKIGDNLVDPKTAYQYAYSGSQMGAQDIFKTSTEELVAKIAQAVSAPIQTLSTKLDADRTDRSRMAQRIAKHQKRQWIYLGLLALPLPLSSIAARKAGSRKMVTASLTAKEKD